MSGCTWDQNECPNSCVNIYMSGEYTVSIHVRTNVRIHVTIAVSIHVRPNYVRMYVPECLSEECLAWHAVAFSRLQLFGGERWWKCINFPAGIPKQSQTCYFKFHHFLLGPTGSQGSQRCLDLLCEFLGTMVCLVEFLPSGAVKQH